MAAWLLGEKLPPLANLVEPSGKKSLNLLPRFTGRSKVELGTGTIREGATRCCVKTWSFDEKWGNYKVKFCKICLFMRLCAFVWFCVVVCESVWLFVNLHGTVSLCDCVWVCKLGVKYDFQMLLLKLIRFAKKKKKIGFNIIIKLTFFFKLWFTSSIPSAAPKHAKMYPPFPSKRTPVGNIVHEDSAVQSSNLPCSPSSAFQPWALTSRSVQWVQSRFQKRKPRPKQNRQTSGRSPNLRRM